MPAILLIKTSSMGDVIHNLPVAGDIREHYPNATLDWVVEEAFSSIPAMHPAVRQVIPVAIRRWRKSPFDPVTRAEFSEFRRRLTSEQYDIVIDTQGLFKSAIIAKLARGTRCGYDRRSIREPVASLFYDQVKSVDRRLHAVTRNRLLASACMGYSIDAPLNYGIGMETEAGPPYAVLLHATSRADKLWSESDWIELGNRLGMPAVLPWGSAEEHARSLRLASDIPGATVPAKLALQDVAKIIAGANIVVGVDTGLSHLAAALGVPVVGIYCSTDPGLTGILSSGTGINLGGKSGPPSCQDVLAACLDFLAK